MESIIVTGANGYIGRNFIKYVIQKGIRVYAVDISHSDSILKGLDNVYFIECSMKDIEKLQGLLPTQEYLAFYHFAWNGVASSNANRNKYTSQIDNIKYSCDAAIVSKKMNCKKFITTGSVVEKATKDISNLDNVTESYYYGIAKKSLFDFLNVICKANNINHVWATLPNIFGSDSEGTIISYMFKEFKENRIPMFGPCQQPYNFTYIKDIVRGLLVLGLNNTESDEYLLSNGECKKLYQYLNEVSSLLSKEIEIGTKADDGLIFKKEWFDNQKIHELGFIPKYSFIEGIKDYLKEIGE